MYKIWIRIWVTNWSDKEGQILKNQGEQLV